VLRQLRPPQRLLTILGGESLLNDATALLVYRVALGATLANSFSVGEIAPAFFGGVIGSILVGPALGWLMINTMTRITHAPTSIIVQFVTTFGVWIFAEHIGLSGVLTTVCYAITLARTLPARVPAALRIPAYAVWDTVVFAVNVFVFIFIGLQLRPILQSLQPGERTHYLLIAAAVLATVIAVRFAWHMPFNTVVRLHERRVGFHPPRPTLRPSLASGLVISWSGMRGIVTLAAALALPGDFPYRDIIVLVAFSVVLGTLVVQGLTLKALLRLLDLHDEDPVGHEVGAARERALEAALATLDDDHSPAAEAVRREFKTRLRIAETDSPPGGSAGSTYAEMHHRAVDAARQAVLAMRARDEIGDDAFHRMEEDLDWLEMAVPWLGDGS
jgi:CPA1 family monovalent cation:H+ antiporter